MQGGFNNRTQNTRGNNRRSRGPRGNQNQNATSQGGFNAPSNSNRGNFHPPRGGRSNRHPPRGGQGRLCMHFQQDRCNQGNCQYLHAFSSTGDIDRLSKISLDFFNFELINQSQIALVAKGQI